MTQIEGYESRWQRWGLLLLPAGTFLVGLALGSVVLLAQGPGATSSAVPGSESSATAGASEGGGDTVVTVPAACEEAAVNITEATRLVDDVVDSVRDFQPQELVELLNELEDIDAETRPLAAECSRVSVSESAEPEEGESSAEASEEPSAEPSQDSEE